MLRRTWRSWRRRVIRRRRMKKSCWKGGRKGEGEIWEVNIDWCCLLLLLLFLLLLFSAYYLHYTQAIWHSFKIQQPYNPSFILTSPFSFLKLYLIGLSNIWTLLQCSTVCKWKRCLGTLACKRISSETFFLSTLLNLNVFFQCTIQRGRAKVTLWKKRTRTWNGTWAIMFKNSCSTPAVIIGKKGGVRNVSNSSKNAKYFRFWVFYTRSLRSWLLLQHKPVTTDLVWHLDSGW